MAGNVHGKESFTIAYAGRPPWDIDEPQPFIVQARELISGEVLDVGCGTGQNAVFLAQQGLDVRGIDFLEEPIRQARQRAKRSGVPVRFEVGDALGLVNWDEQFRTVIDCGLFHVFSDPDRELYERGLRHVTMPPTTGNSGGLLFLQCFSDLEPGTAGPRRVTESELRTTFATGWEWLQLDRGFYRLLDDQPDSPFTPGGAHCWMVVLRRI